MIHWRHPAYNLSSGWMHKSVYKYMTKTVCAPQDRNVHKHSSYDSFL